MSIFKTNKLSFFAVLINTALLLSCSAEPAVGGGESSDNGGSEISSGSDGGGEAIERNCTVSVCGELKKNGSKLVGAKTGDKAVQVRGVSLGWSNDPGWESALYFNANVVTGIRGWNANVIRAPLGVASHNGYTNGGNQAAHKAKITAAVNAAIANDMYVIIDWHAHDEAITPANVQQAIAFFTEMANAYGGYDNVIWEVFNEPINVTWEQIKNFANQIVPIIRAKSDNLILVGSQQWSQQPHRARDNEVTDSQNNIAYTFHFYAENHSFNQLSPNIKRAMDAGLPVFVSEFGTVRNDGAGAHDGPKSDRWLEFLDENGISWCAWQLSHKAEASSFFTTNVSTQSADAIANTTALSASGQYIKNRLLNGYR